MTSVEEHQLQKLKDKRQRGFTLIELVVVLAVLAALASIAIPQLSGLQERAKLNGEATAIVAEIKDAFAQDMVGDGVTFNWNGSCSGYDGGVFDGNTNFDGLNQSKKYRLYDSQPSGEFVKIGLPQYDKSTNQTSQFDCYLGLR